MGRTLIPEPLKILSGSIKEHPGRLEKDRPKQDEEECFALPTLTERGKLYFNMLKQQLADLKMDSSTYSLIVNQTAARLDEIDTCNEKLEAEGLTVESVNPKTGMVSIKPHPCASMKDKAMHHLSRLLAELGLTPASIQRVTTKPLLKQQGKEQNSATEKAADRWKTLM